MINLRWLVGRSQYFNPSLGSLRNTMCSHAPPGATLYQRPQAKFSILIPGESQVKAEPKFPYLFLNKENREDQ